MAQREQLANEQKRLLRIIARMPLASAANLAPILGLPEDRVRRMLGTLRSGGWVESVVRGTSPRGAPPGGPGEGSAGSRSRCASCAWTTTRRRCATCGTP